MPVDEAAKSSAPVASFLGRYLSEGVAVGVAMFAAISAFGTLNGWVLVQAEMPWAMAKGGVFPTWFGAENAAGSPVRSHLVSSSLLTIITLMNYQRGMTDLFGFIASVSLAAGLVAYLMAALAALRLVRGSVVTLLAALIAVGFFFWAEYGLGIEAIGYAALLILAGLPVYLWVRSARASAPMSDPPG
jgi:APA family basic amino acid/polyamine antiporter